MTPTDTLLRTKKEKNGEKSQNFLSDLNGDTLQFYSYENVEKVFEIHHYGEGATLYFKKKVV